ncbi:MAG: putative metal-dependent hydrolase [Flavobacteriia bacterium]|nr:putative metal-dependent hydrolase [Flavobacteriia bacterium]
MKYPIGKASLPEEFNNEHFTAALIRMERLPSKLRRLTENLTANQLQMQYRENSWTVQQLVHHIADSHMNGFIRTKWALSESTPTIKPYNEKKWTLQPDALDLPIEISLDLLDALHQRWTYLLRNLTDKELHKAFIHPVGEINYTLFQQAEMYAWHGDHHYAHTQIALNIVNHR